MLHKSDFHCCFSVTSLQLHWETGFSIYSQPLSSICIMVIVIGSQLSRRWVVTNTSMSEGATEGGGYECIRAANECKEHLFIDTLMDSEWQPSFLDAF